jgi:hypothetical protein
MNAWLSLDSIRSRDLQHLSVQDLIAIPILGKLQIPVYKRGCGHSLDATVTQIMGSGCTGQSPMEGTGPGIVLTEPHIVVPMIDVISHPFAE